MAINLKVLTSIATTNSSVTWNTQAQQTTVLYPANKQFLRNIVLSTDGVSVRRGSNVVGINSATLVLAAALVDSGLTYPPVITANPVSGTVSFGAATTFGAVAAMSELSVTYQWQVSTNGGTSYSNLTNAGVYTNVTTATLSISSVSTLHGYLYRCAITNAAGTTNTTGAILTVVPAISAQPPNRTVAHPTGTTFPITASGTATVLYQWQISTDSGATWNNQANGGVYSNATTATLSISDSTGLTGKQYRCVVTDGNTQATTSNAGILTVT